ncbi:MAG: hypothetical protein HY720_18995 [Planctomycetes bacterium]|nr:hypothetical protein [Planctomycetota bacterium]
MTVTVTEGGDIPFAERSPAGSLFPMDASRANPPLVLPLYEFIPEHRRVVGEKAWNVGLLASRGFRVPDGFVITSAARGRLADAALRESLAGELERLGDGRVAVRSSGAAEDLAGASFAGMYKTVLGVRGLEEVLAAAAECWNALGEERLVAYARRAGLDPARLDLALLVQRLVPAEKAGVLFTVDPTSGDEGLMAVECCEGLGEALVSGRVTPDRYVLDRATGKIGETSLAGDSPILSPGELAALVESGRKVQRSFGSPQDVEFAFAGGELFLLQSRAITALSFAERLGEWTTADFRDGGVSAGVCTPYMWSLYRAAFNHSMPAYFAALGLLRPGEESVDWARMFFGRPYWNVGAVKNCVARLPGFVERNFDQDLAIDVKYEGSGRTTPTTLGRIVAALPVLFRLRRLYRRQIKLNREIVASFDALEAGYLATDPATLDDRALLARCRRLVSEDHFRIETNYFTNIYNLSNAKLETKEVLDRLARRGTLSNYSALVAGLERLRTLEPTHDLFRLASRAREDPNLVRLFENGGIEEILAAFEAGRSRPDSIWAGIASYISKYRYHSRTELDITVPRWDEDPGFVLETLRSAVRGHDPERSPESLAARQREVYEEERTRVAKALGPVARISFRRRLANVRRYTWWREEMRDRSTRTYYLVRRETRELARRLVRQGRLAACEDVWFLSWEDVLALAGGELPAAEAARRIEAARETYEGHANYAAPGEIGSRYRTDVPLASGADEWKGTAASPGRARGRVRVLVGIAHADRLRKGEVLVAPFTDPGWTPLLGIACAVVTETGGLLSHAAVISREYGIPAVLAVKGATRFLADGDEVEVDGTAGVVRRTSR